MSNVSPNHLYAQTAEVRRDVMRDIACSFELWSPSEPWPMPRLDGDRPTPFIAGQVACPEQPKLNGQDIWLFRFTDGKERAGYLVERPGLVSFKQPAPRPDWSMWSMIALTEKRGLQWLGEGKVMPRPMDAAAYGALRRLLRKTTFTTEITKAALTELGVPEQREGLEAEWEKLNASMQRRARAADHQTRTIRALGSMAKAVIGWGWRALPYLSGPAGPAPLPPDPDSDKLQ